jgi:hypothetical protein
LRSKKFLPFDPVHARARRRSIAVHAAGDRLDRDLHLGVREAAGVDVSVAAFGPFVE